jgi:methyl-accepting chemotaxis protein
MFAHTPIRTKITAVVAALLIALMASGAFALWRMNAINASTVDIASNWLPSVRALGDLRATTITYRNVVRQHLLFENAEGKAAYDKRVEQVRGTLAKNMADYEKLITSPEERAIYTDWRKQWDEYMKGSEEVLKLSRASVGRPAREANELNGGTVNAIGLKADDLLNRDIDLNNAGAAQAEADAAATFRTTFMAMVAVVAIASVLGIAAAILLIRDVSRGIASIVTPMQALSNGDLSAEVPHQGERTEIGHMADALQIFKEALVAKKAADEAAAADAEAKIERGRRVDAITRKFENVVGEIVGVVSSASTELEASASTLTRTAEHAQELATRVAAAAEEASGNVSSVASATEEMGSSVNEISRQVQDSARIAAEAVSQAQRTNDRVSELARAAARIGDVVELINTIAGQTNLLALNATIEAARAGDAGRGFAVVASEVKALADQTAKATGEISQQITGIQAATQESVAAIREIGETIGRMSEIAATIASAVEEQGAATQEIARNVQEAAKGTQEVSGSVSEVQHGATETGSASSQVLGAAQSLSLESTRLKQEVESFLSSVRAA